MNSAELYCISVEEVGSAQGKSMLWPGGSLDPRLEKLSGKRRDLIEIDSISLKILYR